MFIMAVYGVLGLGTLGALVYGASQWNLGWTPTALWALPPCIFGVAGTWVMSAIGQRLAQPQMELLQSFIEECLRRASSRPPAPSAAADEPTLQTKRSDAAAGAG
jgi:hypothetical protein